MSLFCEMILRRMPGLQEMIQYRCIQSRNQKIFAKEGHILFAGSEILLTQIREGDILSGKSLLLTADIAKSVIL